MNSKPPANRKNSRSFALACLCACMILTALASSCAGKPLEAPVSPNHSQVAAGTLYSNPIACDSGILYLNSHNFRYFDFETKTEFVLCSDPYCLHADRRCTSYSYSTEATVAVYGDHLYEFKENPASNTYEIIQMSLMAKDPTVLASLPIGNYMEGKWEPSPKSCFRRTPYGFAPATTSLP